tara:strand:- start:132 stop:1001 length:870 start_codon:yes stop_codon:yes gene_type:complete
MISRMKYLFLESFRTFFKMIALNIISSVTIAIALVVFSFLYILYNNVLFYTYKIKSNYEINVFFHADVTYEESLDIYNQILILDGVEEGSFIDKNKSAAIYQKYFDENIMKLYNENPLPYSANYKITPSFQGLEKIQSLASKINSYQQVESCLYPDKMLSKLDSLINNVFGIGFILFIVTIAVVITLVSNTIRLIIHSKNSTIETLHLLGATNWFIKTPLILEGVLQGFLGSVLSIIFLYFTYSFLGYFLDSMIKIEYSNFYSLIGGNIVIGIFLGIFGSYRAVAKYLS